MIFNFEKTKDSLSGPVAIVAVGAEVARSDAAGLFQFAAILNINLAVINILPLPVSSCHLFATLCCCACLLIGSQQASARQPAVQAAASGFA